MDRVVVSDPVVYKTVGTRDLHAQIYAPPDLEAGDLRPAVVFIPGGIQEEVMVHWPPTGWATYQQRARLAAARGLIGVNMTHRFDFQKGGPSLEDGYEDTRDLLAWLHEHGPEHHVDPDRLAIWVISSGGPMISLALDDPPDYLRCGVAYYASLDFRDDPYVQDVTEPMLRRMSPFEIITRGPRNALPIFIARAGRDEFAHILAAQDKFIGAALEANAPIEVMNHPDGRHGFDSLDHDDRSRRILARTMAFLAEQLTVGSP